MSLSGSPVAPAVSARTKVRIDSVFLKFLQLMAILTGGQRT